MVMCSAFNKMPTRVEQFLTPAFATGPRREHQPIPDSLGRTGAESARPAGVAYRCETW
jgi:hypothetical protein